MVEGIQRDPREGIIRPVAASPAAEPDGMLGGGRRSGSSIGWEAVQHFSPELVQENYAPATQP